MAWTHRQADHAAPHHQARTADAAQHAGDRGGRRTRRRGHHARQPVHDRHVRGWSPTRRWCSSSCRPTPDTGTSRWRTSGTSASSRGTGTARSPTRACSPTPTVSCESPSAPRTSGTGTGWTPAVATAASSCCDGSTIPSPRRAHHSRTRRGGVVSADRFEPDRLVEQACERRAATTSASPTAGATAWTGCATAWSTEARLNDLGVEIAVHGHRAAADEPAADHAVAQGESRGRGGSRSSGRSSSSASRARARPSCSTCWPRTPTLRPPLTWEVDDPCPLPQPETYDTDPASPQTQASLEMSEQIVPGLLAPSPDGRAGRPGVRAHHGGRSSAA